MDWRVKMLRPLADEQRWSIVTALFAEPLSDLELSRRFGMSRANVSKHLRILHAAGIVAPETDGKEVRACLAISFREELSRSRNRLVVGCCSFNFGSA